MTRLFDRMDRSTCGDQWETLREAPVIVIDNVARYFYEGTPQDIWDLREDFPTLAPPFRSFWMEYDNPHQILKGHEIEHVPSYLAEMATGIFIQAVDFKNLTNEDAAHIQAGSKAQSDADTAKFQEWLAKRSLDISTWRDWMRDPVKVSQMYNLFEIRWEVTVSIYLGHRRRGPIHFIAAVVLWLDEQGRFRPMSDQERALKIGIPQSTRARMEQMGIDVAGEANRMIAVAQPAYLAVSFMHCKNVELIEHVPPAKLAKKHHKQHRKPLARYYILEIEPMKKVLRHEGQAESTGLRKALHICRGHFKDYRESGLFGKVKGIFWWDSHVRGTPEQGVVVKDYAVKEPAK